jgi:tyrosinase
VDWGVDQATLQSNVRAAVNNLYNAPARQITTQKRTIGQILKTLLTPPGKLQNQATKAITGKLSTDDFNRMAVNNLAKLWAINVAVDK